MSSKHPRPVGNGGLRQRLIFWLVVNFSLAALAAPLGLAWPSSHALQGVPHAQQAGETMPLVQGIRVSADAAPPARRVFNALFFLLFLSPVFYLVWGIWVSGVGYYFIGGSFIFILVAIGDIKKKIAFADRSGVSCCSGLFLTLGLLCLVLAASFVLQMFGVCALACVFGFWDAHTEVTFDRVLFPLLVVLAVAGCELVIFEGLHALLKISSWREGRTSQTLDGAEMRALGLVGGVHGPSTSLHVRDVPGSQWVSRAVSASSEAETKGRQQVEGWPKVYPRHGDVPGAWAPLPNTGEAWIELEYAEAWQIGAIEIYETCAPGSVVAVQIREARSREWHVAWQGHAQRDELPTLSRIFSPPLTPLGFATRHVRLKLDVAGGEPSPEIDAVRVLRHDQPVGAIATATAVPDATLVSTPATAEEEGGDIEAPAVLQAVVVASVAETPCGAPAAGSAAAVGPVPGRVLVRGRTSRTVPPLVDLVEMLRYHLGVCGASMDEVVANACVELSIDAAGMSIMQQATACWRVLGSPALSTTA